jgi:predicted dehydrogenase
MHPRLAVVGCGDWGRHLVRMFAQLGALATICDASEATLAAQAKLYPSVRPTPRYDEVLADAIDAVVIATPAAQHFRHAKEAILAGKDVFVEKPLSLRLEEGRELVQLADARGVLLMVGHVLEYHPAVVLLRELVARGDLGDLRYLYSNRLNLGKVRHEEDILWSFAPHDIAIISRLVGAEPLAVTASGGSYLQPGIVDVTVTALVFPGGVRAHVFVSWLHPYKEQKLVVVGDRKMAVFDDTAREGKLKIYDKGIEWRRGLAVPREAAETTLAFEDTEPLRLECEHFLASIEARRRPLTDGASAVRVLRVLDASRRSLDAAGVPVALEPEAAAVAV